LTERLRAYEQGIDFDKPNRHDDPLRKTKYLMHGLRKRGLIGMFKAGVRNGT